MNKTQPDENLGQRSKMKTSPLDDADFTKRVMSALPRRRHKGRTAFAVVLTTTLLGVGLTALLLPADNELVCCFRRALEVRSLRDLPLLPFVFAALSLGSVWVMICEEP